MKSAAALLKLTVLAAVVLLGFSQLGRREVRQLTEQVNRLESENARLADFAQRLQASRRVAQVDVVKQYEDHEGRVVSVLLWQEIGADGVLGLPQAIQTFGRQVYFEGWVIKSDYARLAATETLGDHRGGLGAGGVGGAGSVVTVKNGDGASVVLFRRIFGEQQTPDSVALLTAAPPMLAGGRVKDEDAHLWERFWDLTVQPELAAQYGVRVAQVEAPAVRVSPGQVWEVTLDAAGGLNLRKAADRPGPSKGASAHGAQGAGHPATTEPRFAEIDWQVVSPKTSGPRGR